MPTVITHGVVSYLTARTAGPALPPRLWGAAFLCSLLPDLDTVSLYLGLPGGHLLGHRGLSHSPLFALLLAGAVCLAFFRAEGLFSRRWWACLAILALATASHGLLDSFTTAHQGVAFLFPFSDERFLFWGLVPAVAVGPAFFAQPELSLFVLLAEIQIFWLPLLLLWALLRLRRRPDRGAPPAAGRQEA